MFELILVQTFVSCFCILLFNLRTPIASQFDFDFVFHLQSRDQDPPDQQAGESGLPSPQSDHHPPPVEDIQVTDIFYEDMVNNSPLESSASAATESSAALVPGQNLQEVFFFFLLPVLLTHNVSGLVLQYDRSSSSSAGGDLSS